MKILAWVVSGILWITTPVVGAKNVFYLPQTQQDAILESFQKNRPSHRLVPLRQGWSLRKENISLNLPMVVSLHSPILLEKTLTLEKPSEAVWYLHVTPQNCGVEVYVNDSLIWHQYQPYFTQRVLLPNDLITTGTVQLGIRLVPYHQLPYPMPEWVPENVPRIFGGLLSAFLEKVQKNQIREWDYRSQVSDSNLIVTWRIHYPGADSLLKARVTYWQDNGIFAIKTLDLPFPKATFSDTLTLRQFWSPSSPHLMRFEVVLSREGEILDTLKGPLANREVAVQHTTFFLNGQRPVLHGSNYILQLKDGVEAFHIAQVYRDLKWLKKENFNSIYVFDHPLPEPFYQICDELGLMVFQALPVFLNGRKGFKKYPSDSVWQAYIEQMVRLAEKHPSIVAIGIAEQYIDASPASRALLQQMTRGLPASTVPYFIHTLIPLSRLPGTVSFQMVEVIKRHRPYVALKEILDFANRHLLFPVVVGKAYTYRVDSTTVVHDLVQIQLLSRFMQEPLQSGQLQGSFIHTYSDYYLNMPSVQNGFHRNLFLNKIGLVNLDRQPRQTLLNENDPTWRGAEDSLVISEAFSRRSYLYVILGLLNAFLFLFIYQRFVEFRRNVLYSIKKPHGFFVNIQERRVIPFSETFLLMFVLALNAGIVWSSIFYFFRNNLVFDYLLSLVFFTPGSKAFIAGTIWHQWRFILLGTVVVMGIFYLLAVLIKLFSLRQQHRILFRQAWSGAVWSASPFLLLFPFVPLMYNLLLTMKSFWIPLGVLLYFHVWIYIRWINALRVLTDRLYGRTFLLISAILLIGMVGMGALFQWEYGLWDHLSRIYQLFIFAHK